MPIEPATGKADAEGSKAFKVSQELSQKLNTNKRAADAVQVGEVLPGRLKALGFYSKY
jgi:hypothetical protein